MYRWTKEQVLSYLMGTHESQHNPAEAVSDAFDFMQIWKKVNETNPDKKNIIYVDQAPVFTSHSKHKKFEKSQHMNLYTGHKKGQVQRCCQC